MNTMHDLEATTYAPTSYAPRGDDVTVASAWSSSPLGDPASDAGYADEAGYLADGYDFPPDPITPARKPKFVSKGVLAGGLIATVGLSAALGMALFGNWSQPRPASVTSGATAAPVAAPAPAVAAPVQTPPDNSPAPVPVAAPPADIPAPAPVVVPQVNIPAPAPVVTPPPDNGPPPADPGSPPAAPPAGPVVIVAPPPVWLPPLHPPLPLQPPPPPSPPHLPPPPKGALVCLRARPLVQGVCK
jgi:hypothetical protein